MKRSIAMSVGALVLSQFLASTALAGPKCFTTGPLENQLGPISSEETVSTVFFVKVLNNDDDDAVLAKVAAFNLNGQKRPITVNTIEVAPLSSNFIEIEDLEFEFEVQVRLDSGDSDNNNRTNDNNDDNDILVSGFGKDASGKLVASHRLVYSEWTKIECEDFGLAPRE